MRRISLVLFFLVSLTFQLEAQDLKFGVKGGLNLSTLSGNTVSNNNPRLAYHFGGFANIALSDRFSLNPELLYLSIGSRYKYSLDDFVIINPEPILNNPSFKSVTRSNYLAIPVNIRYNFTESFGIDFGPQVAFLLNGVDKVVEANDIDQDTSKRTFSGDFEPDYGLNLGFTLELQEKINLQLRYYQGLKNLVSNDFFPDDRRYNIALQMSVGYIIF